MALIVGGAKAAVGAGGESLVSGNPEVEGDLRTSSVEQSRTVANRKKRTLAISPGDVLIHTHTQGTVANREQEQHGEQLIFKTSYFILPQAATSSHSYESGYRIITSHI